MKTIGFPAFIRPSFSPRIGIWRVLVVSIIGLFVLRLGDIMIVRGAFFRNLADSNRLEETIVLPTRGIVVDRQGIPLVANGRNFFAVASESAQTVYPKKDHVLSAGDAAEWLAASASSVLTESTRAYPHGQALSHLVGYIGFPSRTDMSEKYIGLEERVGKTGVEFLFDQQLRGVAGSRTYELSAAGKITQKVSEQLPISGRNITITIDAALTIAAFDALEDYTGGVIVLDIPSSQLLTLTSKPSFALTTLAQALTDEHKPLLNRALTQYPPGSTFKLVTALTALEQGTFTPSTLVKDEGQITVGQQTFGNWYFRQYGRTDGEVNVTKALARSNDIFFYKAAQSVGPERMDEIAFKLGFGRSTGVGLMEEQFGLLPTPEWKEKELGTKWFLGDTYHMGIGQGFVLASPLQIANMTAAIARNGQWCEVLLEPKNQATCEDSEIKEENLQTVIEGMVQACSSGGTAFPFFPYNDSVEPAQKIACKTGTAEYGPSDEKGNKKTHGWMTLFYPREKPKVAITVFLESTKDKPFLEGSKDAGPIALKVLEEWKSRYEK